MPLRAQLSSISLCRDLLCNQRRHLILVAIHLLSAAGFAAPLGVLGGWRVSVPSPPPFVRPRHSVALKGHSKVFVSLGQLFHSGGAGASCQVVFPPHSLATPPPGFSATPEASVPPLRLPLRRTCRPETLSLSQFFLPMAPSHSCSICFHGSRVRCGASDVRYASCSCFHAASICSLYRRHPCCHRSDLPRPPCSIDPPQMTPTPPSTL